MRHRPLRTLSIMGLLLALVVQVPAISFQTFAVNEGSQPASEQQTAPQLPWMKDAMAKMTSELIAKYGEGQRERVERGLKQVSDFWRAEDGDREVFEEFVRTNKAGNIGSEFERMATVGSVIPDLWMKKATGAPVGPEALLAATSRALADVGAVKK